MGRPRKDYRVVATPEPVPGNPDALIVNIIGPGGEPEESYDFSVFTKHAEMAVEWALAFRQHYADLSPVSRYQAFNRIKFWFEFVADFSEPLVATRDIDTAVLGAFIAWLGTKPWSKSTRYSVWSIAKQHLGWLQRNRPDLVNPDLEIPFNAFPRKNAESRPREALSRQEMERVLAAARMEIENAWTLFKEGQKALARVDREAIAAEPDLGRLNLRDLGVMLAVIEDRFGGLPPKVLDMVRKGAGLNRLNLAITRSGGIAGVASRLFAPPETIVAYMIAIGAQTYANAEALRMLRRDCMSEHLLLEGRVLVSWHKGRAGREQRRSFLRDKSFSVPALIDQVLALTERLLSHAPQRDRDLLFLTGGVQASRTVGIIPGYLAASLTRRFVQRHKLRDDSGNVLRLSLGSLRVSGLTLAHERSGFDILKTQALANHATPDTTQRYVDNPRVRKAQAVVIGGLQARFVEMVRGTAEPTVAPKSGVDLRNATTAGFICRDPLSGIAEGQRAGELCTAWLGCFTCLNAVIPLDEDMLIRLLATKAALTAGRTGMAPERWRLLYAPKLEILERDILPKFPDAMLARAETATLPALPPVE